MLLNQSLINSNHMMRFVEIIISIQHLYLITIRFIALFSEQKYISLARIF